MPEEPQLRHAPFMLERYACLVRRGHPISGQPLDMAAYLSLGHIHVSSRRSGPGFVDAELSRLGLTRAVRMRVQHYLVAPLIVQRTDLALTAPESLLRHFDGQLLPLPFDLPEIMTTCIWHAHNDEDPANRWLRETLLGFASRTQPGNPSS